MTSSDDDYIASDSDTTAKDSAMKSVKDQQQMVSCDRTRKTTRTSQQPTKKARVSLPTDLQGISRRLSNI